MIQLSHNTKNNLNSWLEIPGLKNKQTSKFWHFRFKSAENKQAKRWKWKTETKKLSFKLVADNIRIERENVYDLCYVIFRQQKTRLELALIKQSLCLSFSWLFWAATQRKIYIRKRTDTN